MSGLVAAVTAARRKLKCAVLEAENRVGKKILATGNGKCNLSNSDPEPWKHFNAPEFVRPVLERYGKERLKEFWLSVGIALRESDGRIFPYSLEASSVLNALRAEAGKLGVKIFTDNAVDKLEKGFKAGPVSSDNVLLATGSGATTGRGSAFLAEGLGHKCTPIYPSLGPLITDKRNLKDIQGQRDLGHGGVRTQHVFGKSRVSRCRSRTRLRSRFHLCRTRGAFGKDSARGRRSQTDSVERASSVA